MQLSLDNFRSERLAKSLVSRALLVLAALVLTLQLIGTAFHKHDLTEESPDCVSCYMAAHFPANVPAVNAALQAVFLFVIYRLACRPQYVSAVRQNYLIPLSQAPPRCLLSA